MSENKNLEKAWEETGKAEFMRMLENFREENLSSLLNSSDIWKSAFTSSETKNKVLICADERVMPGEDEFKVGTAGQLILDSKEYQNDFVMSFKGKIKAVRSHSGCGAAGIAFSKLSEEEKHRFVGTIRELSLKGLPVEEMSEGDLYGVYHSYNLAQKLGAKFEHTAFSGMRGNKKFHDARIIFWSAAPTCDPSSLTDKFLPPHFLANGLAFGLKEEYCKEELKILSGIALGEHGFGKLFDSSSPFYVISVGKNQDEAKKLNDMAKEALKEFGNRVEFKYYSN